ncbi:hypothetical protein [Streptomyces sp. NPDC021356]|uniref:hypothetical protein n=1 Tax=Streptomyces sp. NPDC021356 TaxID=3154900 RepID=UPI0033D893CF
MIELPEGSWWDWDIVAWDPGRLSLGAGHDISYAHGLELVFSDPVFVTCPATFQDPVFRAPTPDEVQLIARQVGEAPPVLAAFEADAAGVASREVVYGFDLIRGFAPASGWCPHR